MILAEHWCLSADLGSIDHHPQHFEAIVAVITASIVQANDDLQPGDIFINSGQVANAGANRSAVAYKEKPPAEPARYRENTNTEMLLLNCR